MLFNFVFVELYTDFMDLVFFLFQPLTLDLLKIGFHFYLIDFYAFNSIS
jgi:hypothetical protein